MDSIEWTLDAGLVHLEISAASDVGNVRKLNEDSILATPPVFIVADGMGGHANGDQASQVTVGAFVGGVEAGSPTTVDRVLDAVRAANSAVIGIPGSEFAGTTLAGLAIVEAEVSPGIRWMAFNVGDSRIYRLSGEDLVQVSVDHSAVQEMLDAGEITPQEALDHPERNVVTRALGTDTQEAEPDVWLLPAGGEQTFVLCSDGLTKELADDEIAAIIGVERTDPARALIDAALSRNGIDNVSAIVVRAVSAPFDDGGDASQLAAYLEDTRPRGM